MDHVTEVKNAQNGLADRVEQIKHSLGNPRVSSQEREALKDELSEASRLLDYSEQYIPRK